MPISTVSRRIATSRTSLASVCGTLDTQPAAYRCRIEVLEHAQRCAELSEAVDNIVSHQLSDVSVPCGLSAPPSLSEYIAGAARGRFSGKLPQCRVQIFVTDGSSINIAEGVDLFSGSAS